MADTWLTDEQKRKQAEEQWAVPGTARAAEIARAEAQQPWTDDLVDGLQSTAAGAAVQVITDEAAPLADEWFADNPDDALRQHPFTKAAAAVLSLTGYRAGKRDYDKDAKYEELTTGIPFEYHDDIMENDSYDAALRAKARVTQELERGRRMAAQDDGQLASLAGSLFDVDLPLSFMSGGAYGSVKIARTALRASRAVRLGPGAAMRVSGIAQGVNAGLQAGVVVGAADAYLRETTGWQDVANMALQSALLGGGIGTIVKGDVRASVQAAQKEFYDRIARDDVAFREHPDVSNMQADDISIYMPDGEFALKDGVVGERIGDNDKQSTVGAQQVTPGIGNTATPTAGVTPTEQGIITAAETWRHDTGWADRKADADEEWWSKVATFGALNLTTNNFRRLYQSKSAVLNFMAGNVFESANGLGRGRGTAATFMENYHNRMQTHLGTKVLREQLEWAKRQNATWQNSGVGINQQGIRAFNREVMLELNDRRLGRSGASRDAEIRRAADQYELAGVAALEIGKGRAGETALDGFDAIPPSRGYTPYKWDGVAILRLEQQGITDRKEIVAALAQSYRQAGMAAGKDADAVAKAVVHRAITKDADLDMSVMSMLTGDGKTFLRESMLMTGMREADVDQLLDRLTGAQHNRSKESFAKTRNDVDMNAVIRTTDGSDLRIVDLMDQDMHGVWQRYTRQMAGSAALARVGITNRAKRREFIDAARAEQRALGEEPMDAELLEAMFSHFNAGPVHGYARGQTNEGIGVVALAKRITNLSLLEKLGVTQIAETGVAIAQQGLANWMTRGPMAVLDKQLKAGNQAVLDDLAFVTGQIGQEHWHFATWLDLDDTTRADRAGWLGAVSKWTSAGSFVQGYTSAFNQVRSFQQRTTVLGAVDKVLRELKSAMDTGADLSESLRARFGDMGFLPDDLTALEALINNGTVEFTTRGRSTFVNKLNMDKWSPDLAETFGSAIVRNMNQIVQKSMAGEQDAWMHTHAGSILMHLKTFPLQAIQKQAVRNARFMDKQALATVLYGLATAAVASKIRDALDGRESTPLETAKSAFNYSNMTGFIPMIYDPVMTLLGMDEARISQYGPYHDWTPPTVNMLNATMRIPGAVANTLTGEADWYDNQAIKAIPFAGTYVLSRMFD